MKKEEWISCLELFVSLCNEEIPLRQAKLIVSDNFIEFCQYHRIVPQAYQLVRNLPAQYSNQASNTLKHLKYYFFQHVHQCNVMRKNLLEIANDFEKQQIEWLAFKGSTLSQLLYNNDYSRQFIDIDILVTKKNVTEAEKILFSLGYEKYRPTYELSSLQKKIYMYFMKDYIYYHPLKKVCVELHWNLSILLNDNQNLQLSEDPQTVALDGVNVPTLSQSSLFIYLCIHGSLSFWSKLRWLMDVRDFVEKYEKTLNWDEVFKTASKMGFQRCVGQAFYLLNYFFKITVPSPFDVYLNEEKKIKKFSQYIIKQYEFPMLKENLFLRYFRYYFLLSSKLAVIKRCFYLPIMTPLVDDRSSLRKNKKISSVYYVFIKLPMFVLNNAIMQYRQRKQRDCE